MDLAVIGRLALQQLSSVVPEMTYLHTGIDLTRPTEIRALVTQRCNYKCLQCACWRLGAYPEISIDEWKAALASIKEFLGSYTIQFVGGEPFVKKGFLDLLEFCHDESIDFGVITNGSAFASEHVIKSLVTARPLKVEISVDGPTAGIHDRLRGIEGSLERITIGIGKLRHVQHATGIQFPIRIKATLNAVNFRAMTDLVRWAVDRGATTIDIEPIREWTEESKGELWPSPADLGDLQGVITELINMKAIGAPIETSRHKLLGMIPHFRKEKVQLEVSTCLVGLRVFSIDPRGVVSSCGQFAPLGDLTRQSAREIWTGAEACGVRRGTVACTKGCAYGCLATKSLAQKIRRGLMVFGSVSQRSSPENGN
jgi:MoaA/NifB/PqqE/SkfB family radical SAM enzyme